MEKEAVWFRELREGHQVIPDGKARAASSVLLASENRLRGNKEVPWGTQRTLRGEHIF